MYRKLKILKPKVPFSALIKAIVEDQRRLREAREAGIPYKHGDYLREVFGDI